MKNFEPFEPKQTHENDYAEIVIVHEPSIEALLGTLHYSGSLFEKPVNLFKARKNHSDFRNSMKKRGIKVLTVEEILEMNCEDDLNERIKLENLTVKLLSYIFRSSIPNPSQPYPISTPCSPCDEIESDDGHPTNSQLSDKQQYLLTDEYKRESISQLGTKDLIRIILMGPCCLLSPSISNTPLRLEQLTMKPMLNLTFTRDQQIVTNKGLVLSELGALQRKKETEVMKFCFEKMGVKILGKIKAPGTIEGGEFFPCGDELCFLGCGLRTNQEAVNQLIDNDWLGTKRFAVVHDLFDNDQQRMHLDTIFNIVNHNTCVLLETVMPQKINGKVTDSLIRRLVTEYTRVKDEKTNKFKYVITRNNVEFSKYLKENGFNIIKVSNEQQMNYGINFLNLGDGVILSPNESTSRTIINHFNEKSNQGYQGKIEVLDYSGMTTMFGSLHCCSQVLKRKQLIKNGVKINENIPKVLNVKKIENPLKNNESDKKNNFIPSNVLMIAPSFHCQNKNIFEKEENNGQFKLKSPPKIITKITNKIFDDNDNDDEEAFDDFDEVLDEYTISNHKMNKMPKVSFHEKRLDFSKIHQSLTDNGINVTFCNLFPNEKVAGVYPASNILSVHPKEHSKNKEAFAIWHPLEARRKKRFKKNKRIQKFLNENYKVFDKKSLEHESLEKYCEGSTSFVFDRRRKICFFNKNSQDFSSDSKNIDSFIKHICNDLLDNYELIQFSSKKKMDCNQLIWTTGTGKFVLINSKNIVEKDLKLIKEKLKDTQIIEIENEFVIGGLFEGWNNKIQEPILLMSQNSFNHLSTKEKENINKYAKNIKVLDIGNLERFCNRKSLNSIILPIY